MKMSAAGHAALSMWLATPKRVATSAAASDPLTTLSARFPDLTPREIDVLTAVAAGHDNRRIAAGLFVSVATVKSHINSIFAKLGVKDRAAAMAVALERT